MQRFFNSINFVEQHLYDKISVHEIAAASYYSTYHFCRIFKTLVGDSPKEYLRKRRLTVAAERLLKEDIGILHLALDCQFGSQEAFTRAFKDLFQITPAQYRKQNVPFRLLYREKFSPHMLHYLQNRLSMEPEIIAKPAMNVVGMVTQYDHDDLNLHLLWSAFKPYVGNILNCTGTDAFGIYESYEEYNEEVNFSYVCAVEVSSFEHIPEGMTSRVIPEQTYAKFTHKGALANLHETLRYIWGSWLPKSKYEYLEKPDFELYPQGFNDNDPENILYLYIPVRKRKISNNR